MATARKKPKNPNIDLGRITSDLVQSQQPQQDDEPETVAVTVEPAKELQPPTVSRHPGGRPKSAVPTTKMVVYLTRENAKRVKHYAVEHDTQYSKVVDALVTQYLDKLEL